MKFYGKRKITLNYSMFININGTCQCLQIKIFMGDFSCLLLNPFQNGLYIFGLLSVRIYNRISCQIIFVNKHRPQLCLCPFKL